MSASFATKLSTLRRERNLTQKSAAEALGISQALLSHYEKGIRECNLDFVVRAAVFYDVSADYLLGISESRHGDNDFFDTTEIPSDVQIRTKTILRSIMYLADEAEKCNELAEGFFTDFFSLSIKKYLSITDKENHDLCFLCDMIQNTSEIEENFNYDIREQQPLFINTTNNHANKLILNKTTSFSFDKK